MNEYIVKRLEGELPDIRGRLFDPDIEMKGVAYAPIDLYPWDETGYTPEGRAYVFYNDEGLHALLCAKEATIAAAETRFCGNVCCDSCLEFFVAPRPEVSLSYINMESNILSAMYYSYGESRYDRRKPERLPDGVNPTASAHEGGWWAVCYHVPMSVLKSEYALDALSTGMEMRANFYHCDETIHPNFGSWNPIPVEKPDFHQPEHFGRLILSGETVSFG